MQCLQARHNQDALTQLIAVQQAVPVLVGMLSTAQPTVLLGTIKLLGALASTHEEGRLQVRSAANSRLSQYAQGCNCHLL